MLPLWRDQVLVVLAPTHLSMVRLRGLFGKRKVIAKHSQVLTISKAGQTTWQPVLEALSIRLNDVVWQKANLKIVIANSLVRYAVLPWSEATLNADEERRYVKFKMDEVFGVDGKNWDISLTTNSYGNPRVACAVDFDLLNQLRQLALKSHLNIQSVQPHLVAALNFVRNELKGKQLHFLLSDGEKLCTVSIKQGYLQSLRVEQLGDKLSDEVLICSLHRENLINHESNEASQAYLLALGQTQLTKDAVYPVKLKLLNLPVNYINYPAAFLAAARLA